jgi:hypothetical protein
MEGPHAQATVTEGGEKRPLKEILVVVETQTMPVVESWCHWVMDFPLQRESARI